VKVKNVWNHIYTPYVPLLGCIEKPLPFIREEFLSLFLILADWLHME